MAKYKYAGDYRLENVLDRNGKMTTVSVYRGTYYRFLAPDATVRLMKRLYLEIYIVALACWFALLCMNLRRTNFGWLVLVPMALAAIAVLFEGCAMWRLATAGDKVTREHNDKLYGRVASASTAHMILGGIGLVGSILILCTNAFRRQYLLVLLLQLLFTVGGFVMFRFRKNLQMEPVPETENK